MKDDVPGSLFASTMYAGFLILFNQISYPIASLELAVVAASLNPKNDSNTYMHIKIANTIFILPPLKKQCLVATPAHCSII
ncbi:hypothetical protein [Lacrimispora aerotolerans]|jgi:hypothetical protein|uniref:hypothetical protein n=1 Tax=Lacrimispora aerotolerans TaxID=36832 RepID=UPI00047B16C2|nr:hypothetical protein [Lacrimispora aerotolerans]